MQQKMQVFNVNRGNEQLWKEKFHAPNGKAQHALTNGPVSFFLKWGRGFFVFFPLCSQCVPIMFPWGSHQVSKVFPIAPRFYPNWFAQRLNSHVYKLKRGCQREAKFRLLCWECPKFQKYW